VNMVARIRGLFDPLEARTYDPDDDENVRQLRMVRLRSERSVRDFSREHRAVIPVDGLYNRMRVPPVAGERNKHGR